MSIEADALAAFEDGDLTRSADLIQRSALAGPISSQGRHLIDVVSEVTPDPAIIRAILRHNENDLGAPERAFWTARLFDAVVASADSTSADVREVALDLMAAATLAGTEGWALTTVPSRREQIDRALSHPADQVDRLEQEAMAPVSTGLPANVVGRAMVLGQSLVLAQQIDAIRDIERILHAAREPELAYTLEAQRKGIRQARPTSNPVTTDDVHLRDRLTVVIAGGHPTLRGLIRDDLDRDDLANTRDYPSAWEGSRVGRHARDMVAGADLAVIIRRQVAHSTSDQVAAAARSLGVPVVRAETPTTSAVRRVVTSFARSRAGVAETRG